MTLTQRIMKAAEFDPDGERLKSVTQLAGHDVFAMAGVSYKSAQGENSRLIPLIEALALVSEAADLLPESIRSRLGIDDALAKLENVIGGEK